MIPVFTRRFAWRASAAALGFLALALCTPPKVQVCPFHRLTGRPCPLCGLTRGLFELAKGHWRAALAFNALTPLALAMLMAALWDLPGRQRLWTAGLAAFALYGVLRILAPALAQHL